MIAHVQLVDFFVSVERAAHPDLNGRPLIIGARPPKHFEDNGGGFVAAASPEAHAKGVRAGMRLADALPLVPDAACLPGAIEPYLEISAQIDERLRSAAQSIEWVAIDEAWLELGGGAASRMRPALDDVRLQLVRDFGIEAAIGTGATKAVAAVASRLVWPSGMLIVLPGYEARLLAPVDIKRLPGLTDDNLARLRSQGINTLGDLAHASEAVLRDTLGRAGSVAAQHALGIDDRVLPPAGAPKGIVRSARFGTCGATQARAAVMQLADAASSALRRSGHTARQVRLRVRDAAGQRLRTQSIDPSSADAEEIREHVDALVRRLLHPGRELFEAAISLTALSPLPPQLELFSSRSA